MALQYRPSLGILPQLLHFLQSLELKSVEIDCVSLHHSHQISLTFVYLNENNYCISIRHPSNHKATCTGIIQRNYSKPAFNPANCFFITTYKPELLCSVDAHLEQVYNYAQNTEEYFK